MAIYPWQPFPSVTNNQIPLSCDNCGNTVKCFLYYCKCHLSAAKQ